MKEFLFKQPHASDSKFYCNNLLYHVGLFSLVEFIFVGSIGNFSVLSALLVADYRYFKEYA
tara:strand:+ start:73 stop:255 length:183 start_codon:yes stop_codon:yes gene_type:complete